MKLIIDAMGGDNAPHEIVKGAVMAQFDGEIILVGQQDKIRACFIESLPSNITVIHAPEIVTMEDDPAMAMKDKPDSSMAVALNLLASGDGDAVISAGNTGALLTMSTLKVKRIKGIRRAALATIVPSVTGGVLLLDCGANVECTPEYLYQFAVMGSAYAKQTLGLDSPRIGLLNNGAEETKGPPLQRDAHELMKNAHGTTLNFVGNVEARDVPYGACDVIIADGFAGNILLKTMEGVGMFFAKSLKEIIYKNAKTKTAGLLLKKDMAIFKKMMDYAETGGAPLLGISKPVIKAHGSSDARAIGGAIRQAVRYTKGGACDEIATNVGTKE